MNKNGNIAYTHWLAYIKFHFWKQYLCLKDLYIFINKKHDSIRHENLSIR